jgi:hypothetical protein
MKKKNAALLFTLLLTGWSLHAQLFVGGSLGLNSTKTSSTTGSTTTELGKNFNYDFSPEVGYFLSENLALGLDFGIGNNKTTTPITPTTNSELSVTNWSIRPFARYYAMKSGSFSLFGEGAINIGGSSSQTTNGATTTDGLSTSTFGISLQPGIAYDLSDKVSLIAKVGGIYYSSNGTSITNGVGANAVKTETSSPSFGLGLNLSTISFGAIVKL